MNDLPLPDNLQVKLESPNIKERLNLHVKRRLQHDPDNTPPAISECKRSKSKEKDKEKEPKPRKPYQKRVDKIKTEAAAAVATASATPGKGKKGTPQIASPAAELDPMMDDTEQEQGIGGAGGGSPEAAGRSNTTRDRHKNADILNMVLSVKKRALLQDPEVQEFWSNIMQALGM